MRPALPRDLPSSTMNEADDNSDDDRQDDSTGYGDIYLKAGMGEDWLISKKLYEKSFYSPAHSSGLRILNTAAVWDLVDRVCPKACFLSSTCNCLSAEDIIP